MNNMETELTKTLKVYELGIRNAVGRLNAIQTDSATSEIRDDAVTHLQCAIDFIRELRIRLVKTEHEEQKAVNV